MKRKTFIQRSGLGLAGLSVLPTSLPGMPRIDIASNRPPVNKRTFSSTAVEALIKEVKAVITDQELAWMFENCYPNTLDTTVDYEVIDGQPDTFIITGDIDAMWLRDSTAQVWPYLPLITKDEPLRKLVLGLINRQVKCILRDPYANAFYKDLSRESHWQSDVPTPIPGVHERKWEIDSLCYVVRLSEAYYALTKDATVFSESWQQAMQLVVQTLRAEQQKNGPSPYSFLRETKNMIDAPSMWGTGRPVKPVGLISSMFRPSDDATVFPFLIPSNIFAAISLRQLEGIYRGVLSQNDFAVECGKFAEEVETAIANYAVADHLDFGQIYAYEVDGFGNQLFMDDANVPSLMSLAYLGAHDASDSLYQRTRQFLLSTANPWYLQGSAAQGQASPHTGKEKIWPMGIILRAMTSTEDEEIVDCLRTLRATHAGTGFMHEAFHKDNPKDFNRSWFAWANTLFGELIVKVYNERRALLQTKF